MCEFSLRVEYCPCIDRLCFQKSVELGEAYSTYPGHILRVITCFKTYKPRCLGSFTNTDPNRLLVCYGMDPKDGNSKLDCTNATYVIDEQHSVVSRQQCYQCQRYCDGEQGFTVGSASSSWWQSP